MINMINTLKNTYNLYPNVIIQISNKIRLILKPIFWHNFEKNKIFKLPFFKTRLSSTNGTLKQ